EVVTKTLPGQAADGLDAQPHGGGLARRRNAKVEYVHKIKFWDKNSALEKIARHLGMFVDRIEHTGRGGEPIAFRPLSRMTDEELEAIAAGSGIGTAQAPARKVKPG